MNRIITIIALSVIGFSPIPAASQGIPRGMVALSQRVYVDAAASSAERTAIRRRIAAAEAGVAKNFGALRVTPMWQVCVTPECDAANRITSRALTYGPLLTQISSKAFADDKTYLHEHVHTQMASALGLQLGGSRRLPNWFDEGLATVISKTVGYPKNRKADCAAVSKMALPKTRAEFVALSKPKGAGPVYTRSACAVLNWMDQGRGAPEAWAQLRAGKSLP
jgi:hypothetical protein